MRGPVAIVHDWLTSMRGSERVVEELLVIYPDAHVFTLRRDAARLSPALATRPMTVGFPDRLGSRFRALLPLFPLAIERLRLDGYALVISSSHCVALGARARPGALHVAYIHSTMRYVREAQPLYEAAVPGGRLGRLVYRAAAGYLRRWDRRAGARPHALIANSRFTRDRIGRYYGRDAQVIPPPIDTARFAGRPDDDPHAPLLVVSALVPNKRVELAVRAFAGRRERLLVVGEGAERARLERLAGDNVSFLGWVDDDALTRLYAGCRALLHPGVEDFGMVLVEAMAAGKPVIACNEGGAPDVVVDGETGLFMNAATIEGVRAALDRLAAHRFDAEKLREHARGFDRAVFRARFAAAVEAAA